MKCKDPPGGLTSSLAFPPPYTHIPRCVNYCFWSSSYSSTYSHMYICGFVSYRNVENNVNIVLLFALIFHILIYLGAIFMSVHIYLLYFLMANIVSQSMDIP